MPTWIMPVLGKLLLRGLFIVFVVGAMALLWKDKLLKVSQIQIKLINEVPRWQKKLLIEKATQATAGLQGDNLYSLPVDKIIHQLEEDPDLKEARIFRRVPGQLFIELVSNEPPVLFMNSKGILYPVSEQGELMKPLELGESLDLPLLRGVSFAQDVEKRKLIIQFLKALPSSGFLSKQSVSEIWFEKKTGYNLTLSVAKSQVVLGESLGDVQVQSVEKVLRYLREKKLNGRVIDARYKKKVVVRLRNDT